MHVRRYAIANRMEPDNNELYRYATSLARRWVALNAGLAAALRSCCACVLARRNVRVAKHLDHVIMREHRWMPQHKHMTQEVYLAIEAEHKANPTPKRLGQTTNAVQL